MGLLWLARGDEQEALLEFERELSIDASSHLYGREIVANTWYAIGALRLRQQRTDQALEAFERAIASVGTHRFAHVGLGALSAMSHHSEVSGPSLAALQRVDFGPMSVDAAMVEAAQLAVQNRHAEAARRVERSLAAAPAGNAGWLLPIEPLLHVAAHPDVWVGALALLRSRAA
jgi:tetratricopeptide (TPR) repeat protein